jgi:hypothetical protein
MTQRHLDPASDRRLSALVRAHLHLHLHLQADAIKQRMMNITKEAEERKKQIEVLSAQVKQLEGLKPKLEAAEAAVAAAQQLAQARGVEIEQLKQQVLGQEA